jgi:hypothetical protein
MSWGDKTNLIRAVLGHWLGLLLVVSRYLGCHKVVKVVESCYGIWNLEFGIIT